MCPEIVEESEVRVGGVLYGIALLRVNGSEGNVCGAVDCMGALEEHIYDIFYCVCSNSIKGGGRGEGGVLISLVSCFRASCVNWGYIHICKCCG